MPNIIKCRVGSEVIDIETALRLKAQDPTVAFYCLACDGRMRPHRAGERLAAHFEHLNGQPKCTGQPTARTVHIRLSGIQDLEKVLPLFEAYRGFHGASPDVAGARWFLQERYRLGDACIFLAETPAAQPLGFTQLYPMFTSIGLAPIWVLNDLYVEESHRNTGVGQQLLAAASEHAKRSGAAGVWLTTQRDTWRAQHLYDRAGWVRNNDFLFYELKTLQKAS